MNFETSQEAMRRLQGIWRNQFVSKDEERQWRRILEATEPEDFGKALDWFVDKGQLARPTAPEFVAALKQINSEPVYGLAEPLPEPDPEVASSWLARIRAENPRLRWSA